MLQPPPRRSHVHFAERKQQPIPNISISRILGMGSHKKDVRYGIRNTGSNIFPSNADSQWNPVTRHFIKKNCGNEPIGTWPNQIVILITCFTARSREDETRIAQLLKN